MAAGHAKSDTPPALKQAKILAKPNSTLSFACRPQLGARRRVTNYMVPFSPETDPSSAVENGCSPDVEVVLDKAREAVRLSKGRRFYLRLRDSMISSKVMPSSAAFSSGLTTTSCLTQRNPTMAAPCL